MSYMSENSATISRLQYQAREADALRERSRAMLTEAVRAGIKAGLSQVEVARAIGRSQPEVSRLLHFHGSTPLGMKLRKEQRDIIQTAKEHGATNVRVFGSVARGVEQPDSGIDLLVTAAEGVGISELNKLAESLSALLDAKVYVTSDAALRRNPMDRGFADAVDL